MLVRPSLNDRPLQHPAQFLFQEQSSERNGQVFPLTSNGVVFVPDLLWLF